ncbi:hypothetical protein [Limisphaera sp. 4302-co]|uniref:hypothetical protein n=1 Tax=Limisphaera sp. 4302-co TaxID=3400417 RepID=UPI003C19F6A5
MIACTWPAGGAADTDPTYLVAEGTAVSHVLVTPFQTNAFGEPLLEPNALANFSAIFQGTRYRLILQTQPARPDLAPAPPLPFPQKVGTHHVTEIFCDGQDNYIVVRSYTAAGEPVTTQALASAGPYPAHAAYDRLPGDLWLVLAHQCQPLAQLPRLLESHPSLSTVVLENLITNAWFEITPAPASNRVENIRWYRPGYLVDARGRRHSPGPAYAKGVLAMGLFLRYEEQLAEGVVTQHWEHSIFLESRPIAHRDDVVAINRLAISVHLRRTNDPSLEARLVPPAVPGPLNIVDYRFEATTLRGIVYPITNQWLARDHPFVQGLAQVMATATGQSRPQQFRRVILGRILLVALLLALPAALAYRRWGLRTNDR